MKANEAKNILYHEVGRFKERLGYQQNEYQIDIISALRSRLDIVIEEIDYSSRSLQGAASFGTGENKDIILLNTKRTEIEKKFDCCHEALHLWLHRDVGIEIFNCFEAPYQHINHFYEWQSQEGSEEFFIPYKAILPIIKEHQNQLTSREGIQALKRKLSKIFDAPDYMIDYRLESIRYEIQQYLDGVPLDEIQLVSIWEQDKRNIAVKSIKDMEMEFIMSQLHSN